jgi:signal transduction histidine kinase
MALIARTAVCAVIGFLFIYAGEISGQTAPFSVEELNKKAASLIPEGEIDSARFYIDKARLLAEERNDTEGLAFAIANLGNVYMYQGKIDSVLVVLEEPYQRFKDTSKGLNIGNLIATAYRFQGRNEEALDLYLELQARAERENNITMQTALAQNIAVVYEELSQPTFALEQYTIAQTLAEAYSDSNTLAVVLNNIGGLHRSVGNNEQSLDYHLQSLEIARSLGNLSYQADARLGTAIAYRELKEFDLAIDHLRRALEDAERLGDIFKPVQIFYNLGLVYSAADMLDESFDAYQKSLELSNQYNIAPAIYYNNIGLANLAVKKEDYNTAIRHFNISADFARNSGNAEMISNVYSRLAQAHENSGDLTAAYPYMKRFAEISDSLRTKEKREITARFESLIDTQRERQRNERLSQTLATQRNTIIIAFILLSLILIALLGLFVLYRKKVLMNYEISEKTAELEKVSVMKEQLLNILAHDLRSPITNLQSIIHLIKDGALEKSDIDMMMKMIDLQLIQSTNTLTNYLNWAQSQNNSIEADITEVNLFDVVSDIKDEMKTQFEDKDLDFVCEIEPDSTVMADKDMIKIVIRNLFSNAIKYSNPGGLVSIDQEEKNGKTEIRISDTGVGISKENLKKLFQPFLYSVKGTNNEKGSGLGLSICSTFMEKQGGSIRCESIEDAGTSFILELNRSVY